MFRVGTSPHSTQVEIKKHPIPSAHRLHGAASRVMDAYLEQEVGGEGQAARAELLEGLGAAEIGGAAAAAAASVEAAAGKPTAG